MNMHKETFQVTVQINPGLEPTTFTVSTEESNTVTSEQKMVFKLSRDKDKEPIAELSPDKDHRWQQIKGNLDNEDVDAIGAAIDAHYAQ